MKKIKYFLQFLGIISLFIIFKIIGLTLSRIFSGYLLSLLGPLFRSKKIIHSNLITAFPELSESERKKIIKNMWFNYGQILAEYMFIKDFRKNSNYSKKIIIENFDELKNVNLDLKPVIFISGHFNNFELMAMQIEKAGVDCAAIYRPLNNPYLNSIMETIRIRDICKNQIKKGRAGTREIIRFLSKGTSIALMIDQRVREGEKINFFGNPATTTTIPAQLIKKYGCSVVPIYIERKKSHHFKMYVSKPIKISRSRSMSEITKHLNDILEKMILKNIDQWIWTHDRWKV